MTKCIRRLEAAKCTLLACAVDLLVRATAAFPISQKACGPTTAIRRSAAQTYGITLAAVKRGPCRVACRANGQIPVLGSTNTF
jgi:hypothetical protein